MLAAFGKSSAVRNRTGLAIALACIIAAAAFFAMPMQEAYAANAAIEEGAYIIRVVDGETEAIAIPRNAMEPGDQACVSPEDGSLAQRLYVRLGTDGTFAIQSVASGLYLADAEGKVVQQKRDEGASQRWWAYETDDGVALANVDTGRYLAVSDGALVTVETVKAEAPRFRFDQATLLPGGRYELRNASSGFMLDVADGAAYDGANVQVCERNGAPTQLWYVTDLGDGWYSLINSDSWMALEVFWGLEKTSANVQQATPNGSVAQRWKPQLRVDGGIGFVNQNSGKAFAAFGKRSNANVCQIGSGTLALQCWYLIEAETLTGDAQLDAYIDSIIQRNDNNLYACFTELSDMQGVAEMEDEYLWGVLDEPTTRKYATYVMERDESDCYGGSAVFAYIARKLGYPASVRAGSVPALTGAEVHGWSEVYIDGWTYVCDVSLARAYRDRYWFMITYDEAPVEYIF